MHEEQVDPPVRDESELHETGPTVEVDGTGVPEVDAVLSDVATGVQAPVAEHVAVFERAHERLRRALDSRTDA